MPTLTTEAIDLLPFAEEAMGKWSEHSDIYKFVTSLYRGSDYNTYGYEEFDRLEKEFKKYCLLSTKNMLETSESCKIINFYEDKGFGEVAKYTISFKSCISQLLSDAGFYSLAHVLEAESDMECSLLLASNFYYKQAVSMLRNILEEVFLPIHFCDNMADFDEWKINNFRTPSLRGNNGLIKRLLKKSVINDSLATQISNLYGSLSAYVHGSEQTLIHRNIHRGEVHCVEYDQVMFTTWCRLFCDCINISVVAPKSWTVPISMGGIVCQNKGRSQ